jgi:osmotically-inducible protein OsmY
MKNNEELQRDVQNAIKWEPLLNAAEIGVAVKDGVVTLTGSVDSYAKKMEAEKAAMNVAGVKAVAEELKVKLGSWGKKTDTEIATSAVNALKWNWQVPSDKVKVKVQDGWLTLTGEVQWNYEREAAHDAVRTLPGVVGVTNTTTIQVNDHNKVEQERVEDAIARHWSISDQDIEVEVSGSTVTLTGTVGSLYQKRKAGNVAWNTPGIFNVNNDLLVEYDYAAMAL